MIELFTIIGTLSALIYLCILLYLGVGIMHSKKDFTDDKPFVSVIVAAHNESMNIATCLDSILNQRYPQDKTEIIIVNDRSTDDTELILNHYLTKCNNLQVINIDEKHYKGIDNKINALNQGIARCTGDIIITTDADCIVSKNWIKIINSYFTFNTGMVVGLSPIIPTAWWLSRFICIDALLADLVASGSLGWNHAVTCTGRNLAYRRSVYEEVNGFAGIDHLIGVDDDLFMQKIAKNTNWRIRYILNGDSSVNSASSENFSHFISQRKRHISTAKYFPFPIQLGFGLLYVAKFFILISFIILLLTSSVFNIHFCILLLTFILTFILLYFIAHKTRQTSLLLIYPLWELYYILNQIVLGPMGLLGRITWDSRHDLKVE